MVQEARRRLHNFHTSSTSFRVRIGLNLKGLSYEYVPVTLRFEAGDHDSPEYKAFNPQGNVPVLVEGQTAIAQSIAILEYLEETYPEPPLLPADGPGRARVRSLALHVACEIQPPNNLRVERYLVHSLGLDDEGRVAWRRHWITVGFIAIEQELARGPEASRYCHGHSPTLADCCLIPQVYNSQRPVVGLDLAPFPRIARIYQTCLAHPAFERALPEHQPGWQEIKDH